MRRRNRREGSQEHLDRWLISYSDFLTLMFTFFAALYALSTVDKEKVGQFSTSLHKAFNVIEKPVQMPEDVQRNLMTQVRKDFANIEGISVKSEPRGIVITLSNDTAFTPGSAEIKEDMAAQLLKLAALLKTNPGRIVIEGHTDNVPVMGGIYKSNWELSAARSASVLHVLIQEGLDPNRFIIAGYGEYRPLDSNASDEGRARNRRVELILAPPDMR